MEDAEEAWRLFHLSSSASSAASSAAHFVDAYVKEAMEFFKATPKEQTVLRHHSGATLGEDTFQAYARRVLSEATAAAEACEQVRRIVARDCGGADGNLAASSSCSGAALAAAARVSTHVESAATTAREAAQLSLGILEDAVIQGASVRVREAAKRSAEQALHSIEAALAAEEQHRCLRDKLDQMQATLSILSREDGQTQLGVQGAASAIPRKHYWAAGPADGGGPRRLELQGAASAIPRKRYWWDHGPNAVSVLPAATSDGSAPSVPPVSSVSSPPRPRPAAPLAPATLGRLEEALAAAEELEKYLCARAQSCVEAYCGGQALPAADADQVALDERHTPPLLQAGGASADPADEAEKERVVRAIVDWRYGLALAQNTTEESILQDVEVWRLASWRSPPDEGLPEDFLQLAKRHGEEAFAGLVAALQSATLLSRPEARANFKAERTDAPLPAFPGPFHQRPAPDEPKVESGDWEDIFYSLDWMPREMASLPPSLLRPKASPVQTCPEAMAASIAAWLVKSDCSYKETLSLDPAEEVRNVEELTMQHLHVMSMQSRSKQRRCGAAKHKSSEDTAAAGSSSPVAASGAGSAPASDQEAAEVRKVLQQVLGDWELPDDSQGASSGSALGAGAVLMMPGQPAPAPTGMAGVAATKSRSGKKNKSLMPGAMSVGQVSSEGGLKRPAGGGLSVPARGLPRFPEDSTDLATCGGDAAILPGGDSAYALTTAPVPSTASGRIATPHYVQVRATGAYRPPVSRFLHGGNS